jgi:glutamate-ammonia-ligase adenylyltransferase
MFIGDDVAGAGTLKRTMSELTAEGRVFPIDARLRPEGNAGPLACSIAAFTQYFESGRGQFWEAQALTKSRPISGPEQSEWLDAAQTIWRQFGNRPDLARGIAAMHDRVVKERTGGDDYRDFKTGSGGLMQAEFFAQGEQMKSGIWEPNTCAALRRLGESAVLSRETAQTLIDAYQILRRIEGVLRRVDETGVSKLPADPLEQSRLARRAGFEGVEAFQKAYEEARETIRQKAIF